MLPKRTELAVPVCHSLRTSAYQAPPAPSCWIVRRPHGVESAGAERPLTRRRSHEAAHGKVYFLPAFLSVENVMLAKPMPEDRSNLPRRAAGDRE